jgi:hypothetical protein
MGDNMDERKPTDPPPATPTPPPTATASLFDLRTVIAALFGVYGVILTILGLVQEDPEQLAKAGGIDLNLWTGIGMIAIAGIFVTWLLLRPAVTGGRQADGG